MPVGHPVSAGIEVVRVEDCGVDWLGRIAVIVIDDGLREITLLLQGGRDRREYRCACVVPFSLPAEIKERAIRAFVKMRYGNWTTERKPVIVLMKSKAGGANVVVDPAVAVQDLVAEILKQAAMKLIGAALGVHGDDAAGVAAMIGGQHTTLNPKLADAVRRWNRSVDRIELRVLQLVAVHRNAG